LVTQSDYLYDEVLAWFKSHEGKDMSGKVQMYMLSIKNKEYVNKFEWSVLIPQYDALVKDKDDLPHICSYFINQCDRFVTTNRRLTQMRIKGKVDFKRPYDLVRELGLKPFDTPDGV
jgi:hypothetical protein